MQANRSDSRWPNSKRKGIEGRETNMIVKTYYSTGRLDVFDTTAMADATVIPGNLMANWTLRLKDLDEEQALWMTMFWYEAVPLEKTAEYAGLPIARLREGWSFVLVDIDEISHLERVEVDGKTALVRQGGYLMDCVSLDAAADRAFTVNPKAAAAYDYYLASEDAGDPKETPKKACERIGCKEAVYEMISLAQRKASREEEYREDDTESLL